MHFQNCASTYLEYIQNGIKPLTDGFKRNKKKTRKFIENCLIQIDGTRTREREMELHKIISHEKHITSPKLDSLIIHSSLHNEVLSPFFYIVHQFLFLYTPFAFISFHFLSAFIYFFLFHTVKARHKICVCIYTNLHT